MDAAMRSRFNELVASYRDIELKIADPDIMSNREVYQELLRRHSELDPMVATYADYEACVADMDQLSDLLQDPELREMAKAEWVVLDEKKAGLARQLQLYLIPQDPNDRKNAMVEIRSGTGGEEAALFAADLFRMYQRYADRMGWKLEVLSEAETGLGGLKEIVFSVLGKGTFSRLKYESGTHRVQRVPDTEASGRVHTSAATVAILPEADELDIKIDTKDLKIDTFRASGAGGQHVNKTSSAIRITHLPTGTVVVCQDERSQFQNKDKALRILTTRLMEKEAETRRNQESSLRKEQVGSGDRSEKIRTYNYPQNRVTDHRINVSLHSLDEFMDGRLDGLIDALISHDQMERLSRLD